jgi:hypothetical protein
MIPESWTVYLGYDQIDSGRKGKGLGNFVDLDVFISAVSIDLKLE